MQHLLTAPNCLCLKLPLLPLVCSALTAVYLRSSTDNVPEICRTQFVWIYEQQGKRQGNEDCLNKTKWLFTWIAKLFYVALPMITKICQNFKVVLHNILQPRLLMSNRKQIIFLVCLHKSANTIPSCLLARKNLLDKNAETSYYKCSLFQYFTQNQCIIQLWKTMNVNPVPRRLNSSLYVKGLTQKCWAEEKAGYQEITDSSSIFLQNSFSGSDVWTLATCPGCPPASRPK